MKVRLPYERSLKKEYIERGALKSLFDERYDTAFMQMHTRENKEHWESYATAINWGRNTITEAPAADVVEVVRCKDCKHWDKDECECSHWYGFHENDFCSYGELRKAVQIMTDNDIVKALECCKKPVPDCDCCPIERGDMCFDFLKEAALDLINRQKAEIERLREIISVIDETLKKCATLARAEAIKEFAERLSVIAERNGECGYGRVVYIDDANDLVKRMTGETV